MNKYIYSVLMSDNAHLSHYYPDHQVKVITSSKSLDHNPESIVILHGGEDISPELYFSKKNPYTWAPTTPSDRDYLEWDILMIALSSKMRILGICRGAQMLCIAAGGDLYQHVTKHNKDHKIILNTGEILETTSAHHQMMCLDNIPKEDYNLIGWCKNRSIFYMKETTHTKSIPKVDPEIVSFPKMRAFAIQGHPEWDTLLSPFVQTVYPKMVDFFKD